MKALFVITAIVEAGAGTGLVVAPSKLARLLIGSSLDTPAALTVARIAGAAVLALTVACWSARNDTTSRAVRGIIVATLVYNLGTVAALTHAATIGLHGFGLWPTAVLHTGLAAWCGACLARPDGVAVDNSAVDRAHSSE